MNPRRLHALFSAYSRPLKSHAPSMPMTGAGGRPTQYIDFDEPITDRRNLAEYFMKG